MKVLATVAAAALSLFALVPASQAASYNCSGGALNYSERTICDNPQLSRLDSTMSATYFRILRPLRGAVRSDFQKEQVNWLDTRNFCGASVACLADEYGAHIADLRSFYAP